MIIQAFNDIRRKPLPEREGVGGFDDLRTIAALQVGTGNRAFKADQSGQWMGANKFANAPFRVNMAGDVVASSIVLGSGYSKINIFKQDGIPTSISTGDLWFDTNDNNKLYRAGSAGANEVTGGEWEAVRDATIATAQNTADSKIKVFKQDGIPTSISAGDLWFDTNDKNKLYRAGSVGANEITGGEWEVVRDTDIAQAISDASDAQGTADGAVSDASDAQDTANLKIKVFAQDAIPTSVTVGDIWYDTNDDNKPYVAESVGANEITGGEWVLIDDQRAADALLKAGSSQVLTGNFNLNDANIVIDGANKRIMINDGSDDRILIGYQSGGF